MTRPSVPANTQEPLPHTRVSFLLAPIDPWRDILMVELGELGYETFEEVTGGLDAYIPADRFDVAALSSLLTLRDPHVTVSWSVSQVEERNWNEDWERSFQPVEVGRDVRIRADHHPTVPGFRHEIIITPRMAFGTGHHATTRMMVRAMLGLDLAGRTVCDLGCGTAVLAILAERLGASRVRAIDIDEQAVINARENVGRNGCHIVTVDKGVASDLEDGAYDCILANIERNTLIDAMPRMAAALRPGGVLLLSGFILGDRASMAACAGANGLSIVEQLDEGEWCLLGCRAPIHP
jgi:ribosomal protein L11 methyltransferase